MYKLAAICLLSNLHAADFPPVASAVSTAKKVVMRNASTDTASFDYLYRALKKWGRWEIVADEKDADIVLAFATDDKGLGSIGIIGSGSGSVIPLLSLQRTVVLVNKDKSPLLQISCEERILVSGTAKCLVKKLRERIEPKK